MMDDYYRKTQESILVKRDIICSLLNDPRIIGDYYEAIIRDVVRDTVSSSFGVGRGVVLADDGRSSRETDIIVYSASEYGTLFRSGDIVVVSPESVRCVIQVKGSVSNDNLQDAFVNLASINELRPGIWKFIVAFKTNTEYASLVKSCAESKKVNGIFVFSSTYKNETEDISLQWQKLANILRSITAPGMYQTNNAGNYVALNVTGKDTFEGVAFPS